MNGEGYILIVKDLKFACEAETHPQTRIPPLRQQRMQKNNQAEGNLLL